jgi:iron complex outermembrane receptor protein
MSKIKNSLALLMQAMRAGLRISSANVGIFAGASVISITPSWSAWAQTATTASSPGLEEIVVTATRRETNLEQTPISIAALSATDIEKNRVVNMSDVTRLTPGLVYVPRGDAEAYLSLRGAIIFDDSAGTDPAVSLFVDDVVRVSVSDVQPELFDMERVEVLKGPQGTLFGRNSIGGVVSIYTKQPTFKTEGTTEVTYGDHNLTEVRGMFNTPLIDDKLAARIVLEGASVSGNVRDITTGRDLNGEHRWAARGELLFSPSEDFRYVTSFDYLHKEGSNSTWIVGNFQPSLVPGVTYDPEQTSQITSGQDWLKNWGLTGRGDWTTGIGTFTSITGYRHLDAFNLVDSEPAPVNIADTAASEHDTQITQELRWASPTGRRLSWVTGLYFLHNEKHRELAGVVTGVPGTVLESFQAFPSPISYVDIQSMRTTSAAPFADLTYAITDQLKIDVGGRYTWQQKTGYAYVNPSLVVAGPAIDSAQSASWTAFTPKLTVSYQPIRELLTYATASKGFLSGGFNAQGSTSIALGVPFGSEYVWNYELGAKFLGLNNRLQINVAGFLDRYTELQIIQYNPQILQVTTTNAGAANVDGIETDISGAPVDWLTVGLKYDYLRSKFTQYLINNGDGTFTDNAGKRVPFTPSSRLTASAEVHTDLPAGAGRVAVGGDYTRRSDQQFDAANDLPSDIRRLTEWRGVINLHASWYSQNDRWEALVWGKNVSNQHYAVFAQDSTNEFASLNEAANPRDHIFEIQTGPYRSFGVTLTARF